MTRTRAMVSLARMLDRVPTTPDRYKSAIEGVVTAMRTHGAEEGLPPARLNERRHALQALMKLAGPGYREAAALAGVVPEWLKPENGCLEGTAEVTHSPQQP